jgi:hypothetical protein
MNPHDLSPEKAHGNAPTPASADVASYVRLHVEVVLEISDPAALARAAQQRIAADELMPDAERVPAAEAVSDEPAEAVAYLVDPIDLVVGLPGVELAQASWSSEATDGAAGPDTDWFADQDDDEL